MSPPDWPGDGGATSYDSLPSSSPFSLVTSLLDRIVSSYRLWYGALDSTSRIVVSTSAIFSFVVFTRYLYVKRHGGSNMTRTVSLVLAAYALGYFALVRTQNSTTTAPASEFTIPSTADTGRLVIPNIIDPQAVDAQTVCPGYKATNVQETKNGLTADLTLAGEACNVYGNDVEELILQVEYQALDRLNVRIRPKYIGQENYTWFILPEELLPQPGVDSPGSGPDSDLDFSWSNEPTFSFKVGRKSTGDMLFTTEGTQLVYEDQFIEFKTSLPENYNLYGLGEVIHGFRLGNNLTSMCRLPFC